VYTIFKRQSIDTALLQKISEVLNFDFFKLYSDAISLNEYDKLSAEQKLFVKDLEIKQLKDIINKKFS
jgi:hypothetical protein